MSVTSHVYPHAQQLINTKQLDLSDATSNKYFMGLLVNTAATWGGTQQAYQFVADVTGAYTEVTSGGYARVALAGITMTQNTDSNVWTCTSPISFGSSITLAAAAAFVFTKEIGSADASWPVISIIDFGGTVTSTAGAWTYTVDPTNGLAYWTEM